MAINGSNLMEKSLQVTSDIISKISSPLNRNWGVAKSINDHFESDYNID